MTRHLGFPLLSFGRERPERVSTLLRSHQRYQQYLTRLLRCHVWYFVSKIRVYLCAYSRSAAQPPSR